MTHAGNSAVVGACPTMAIALAAARQHAEQCTRRQYRTERRRRCTGLNSDISNGGLTGVQGTMSIKQSCKGNTIHDNANAGFYRNWGAAVQFTGASNLSIDDN